MALWLGVGGVAWGTAERWDLHAAPFRYLALGERERAVRLPLVHTEGHLLVVGTTGAGKTRLFDLVVTQAVLCGEAVVIIDPKGDC